MIIGIPMSTGKIQYYINQAYVDYVKEAGLEPLLINPKNDLSLMAATCAGLLLPGGVDIDPTYYGHSNYSSMSVEPEKDAFERELLHLFLKDEKPVFGICRGLQLIARELMMYFNTGKKLRFHQHVEAHALNGQHGELNLARNIAAHHVKIKKGVLYEKGGTAKHTGIFVNSMHHQCLSYTDRKDTEKNELNDLAFEILAQTTYGLEKGDKSIIVEAFRLMWNASRVLAVQWHPEELRDYSLLTNFFKPEEEAADQVNKVEA